MAPDWNLLADPERAGAAVFHRAGTESFMIIAFIAASLTIGSLYGIGLCLIPKYELGDWDN